MRNSNRWYVHNIKMLKIYNKSVYEVSNKLDTYVNSGGTLVNLSRMWSLDYTEDRTWLITRCTLIVFIANFHHPKLCPFHEVKWSITKSKYFFLRQIVSYRNIRTNVKGYWAGISRRDTSWTPLSGSANTRTAPGGSSLPSCLLLGTFQPSSGAVSKDRGLPAILVKRGKRGFFVRRENQRKSCARGLSEGVFPRSPSLARKAERERVSDGRAEFRTFSGVLCNRERTHEHTRTRSVYLLRSLHRLPVKLIRKRDRNNTWLLCLLCFHPPARYHYHLFSAQNRSARSPRSVKFVRQPFRSKSKENR